MSTHSATQSSTGQRIAWRPWSPTQLVVALLGGFFIVLGTLALSNTGVAAWTSPRTTVWGFAHTPLMAIIEIALGFSIILAAPYPLSARGSLLGLGVLMAVFGIVTIVDHTAFRDALGVNHQMGWLYLTSGLGSAVLGSVVPVTQ